MSFLEKLKTIGIDIPKIKSLISIRISLNFDKSVKIEGSTVLINPGKFNRKQQDGLKDLIRTFGLKESGAILDEDCMPTVKAAIEALPDIEVTAKKFLPIIPPSDVPLLYACLYLRKQFLLGVQVASLKEQIARSYGQRGRNFSNLCSAGYLEDYFWPLYETLLPSYPDNPEGAKAHFLLLYNDIVNELPWYEFISAGTRNHVVVSHIVEKLKRNIQNGVRFMNIHGIGSTNVKKTIAILPDIQKQTGSFVARIDQDLDRIFVRLEVSPPVPTILD